MIFRIKTKKDKRIEELEQMLYMSHYKTPRIISSEKNIITLVAKTMFVTSDPIEYIKKDIARKMIDEIEQYIHYDVEEGERYHKVLTGYLRIVID